ncbi:juvenile hormone acid O-methyltransferase [Phymastichus coffea]|uniref:juvenile hormone acid O-methyltransferase n=1 Tax=Phymastichus coffea TaxID=108790 RepID=UPI00273CD4D6|nr:juvenile hormone acid O-methyltransferase [Phymastichus coffea]
MNGVQDYLEAHQLQTRDANDVIEEFQDEIAKMQGCCLDIGCGPASTTRKLFMPKLPADATVVGGDISKKMVDFAKATHVDEKRLSFVQLNIEADNLPSNHFEAYDNAVSFYCLHWCQNIRKVFDNMYKLLRPGGKSLVLFLAHNTGFDSYLRLSDDPKYKPFMKDVSKYIPYFQQNDNPRATLKKMLEESGFKVHHCSFREKTFIYNRQILKKHAIAVNPFIERMPLEIREQFEEDLLREIISRKISFGHTDNGSKEESKVLDRYHIMIAHFEKIGS